MARKSKIYKHGDRLQVYLSNNLEDDFIDWINKQSDKSNFFLYAAAKLYDEYGPIDMGPEIPRRIVLKNKKSVPRTIESIEEIGEIAEEETTTKSQERNNKVDSPEKQNTQPKKAWTGTDLGDDDTFG